MGKGIDLTSPQWLEIVFEGKNKKYGAYFLWKESSDRHKKALIIITIIILIVTFLPQGISLVIPKKLALEETVQITMMQVNKEILEETQLREVENIPPSPLLKETIPFSLPIIEKDKNIKDEQLISTQQELTDNKADISVATTMDVREEGIDITDIQDDRVVVQEINKIFTCLEGLPSFPGGEKGLLRWLKERIKYPIIAVEQGIEGCVVLRFVIDKDGMVSNVIVQNSLHPICDLEAVRVVKKMPRWIPGKKNGNSVRVCYTLPVLFKLKN